MKKGSILILLLGILTLTAGCNDKQISAGNGFAQLLKIEPKDGYEEVIITNQQGKVAARYALVDKNSEQQPDIPSGVVEVRIPVERIILDSEVYAGALEELNSTDRIKGMFDAMYATSSELREKINNKKMTDLGTTSNPNRELMVTIDPEIMILSYFEGMKTEGLDQVGVPIIKMYDLQEQTPLGRAEWIRLLGRLSGKAEKADTSFSEVTKKYEEYKKLVSGDRRPKVLTEIMYEGTWNVAAANSYHASLIKDAGGDYFEKKESTSGSLNLLPEQVLEDGSDADIWLIRFYGSEEELNGILDSDPVYKEFEAYKNGNIYFSDTSKNGLFREFPFHPELLLEDYIKIFKGEGENLRYYRKLKK